MKHEDASGTSNAEANPESTDEQPRSVRHPSPTIDRNRLHPDLRPWLMPTSSGWQLNHRFVQYGWYTDDFSERCNAAYEFLRTQSEIKLKEGDWLGYIITHTRPYRVFALQNAASRMSDADYWQTLAATYTDTENYWQNKRLWRSLLSSKRPSRERMMSQRDKEIFVLLPELITVYRGYRYARSAGGWSWTTDKSEGEWFAYRGSRNKPYVATGVVRRVNVIAYLDDRGESEVVADPKRVQIVSRERLLPPHPWGVVDKFS